jgi:uncharacterized damage-inducible protein DinB
MSAIQALLSEYNKVIDELIVVVEKISDDSLIKIQDHETKDEDCKSIQTILTHMVYSGRRYTYYLSLQVGESPSHPVKVIRHKSIDYVIDLRAMFDECNNFFTEHPKINMLENAPDKKIHVSWGQVFDGEQLMEHAIVHIMRHRRQIERFKSSTN